MIQLFNVAALIIASSLLNQPLEAPENPLQSIKYGAINRAATYPATYPATMSTPIPTIVPVEEPAPKGKWVWAKVTAYSPHARSCGQWAAIGLTSTGVPVRSHNPDHKYGLASDPRDIPYGTSVYIKEYDDALQRNANTIPTQIATVDDTGGDMRKFRPHWRYVDGKKVYIKYHIDVRFIKQSTAVKWGVKYLEVFIYE